MTVTLLQLLKRFGLSSNQSKAYTFLFNEGEATAGKISKATKIPRSKTYPTLYALVEKGLAHKIPSKPIKFRATSFENIKAIVEKENKLLNEVQDKPFAHFPLYLTLGQRNVMRQYTVENSKAKTSILSLVRGLKGAPLNIKASKSAVKRGVEMKILALNRPDVIKVAKLWIKAGIDVRIYEKVEPEGLRFNVYDNELVRFTIGKPEVENSEDYTTIWIKSRAIAAMCKEYFEVKWSKAKKV